MGTAIFYLLCLGIGLGMGYLMRKSMNPTCHHLWEKTKEGEIYKEVNGVRHLKGFVKFYECTRCGKMKKEEAKITE